MVWMGCDDACSGYMRCDAFKTNTLYWTMDDTYDEILEKTIPGSGIHVLVLYPYAR